MKNKVTFFGKLSGFLLYLISALPTFLIMISKSDQYRDLFNETGQNAFQILSDQYRWYAIFAILFPALILLPLYNFIFLKIVTKGGKQYFYFISFLLGCIIAGFMYFISLRNSPTSIDVRILEWGIFLIIMVYEFFFYLKMKTFIVKQ